MDNALRHQLKTKIMKRVFGMWLLKSVVPLFVLELIGGIAALYAFSNLIFFGKVVDNALATTLGNPFELIAYFWRAFLAAKTEVQVIIVVIFIAFGLTLRNINRSIISYALIKRGEIYRR